MTKAEAMEILYDELDPRERIAYEGYEATNIAHLILRSIECGKTRGMRGRNLERAIETIIGHRAVFTKTGERFYAGPNLPRHARPSSRWDRFLHIYREVRHAADVAARERL